MCWRHAPFSFLRLVTTPVCEHGCSFASLGLVGERIGLGLLSVKVVVILITSHFGVRSSPF